MLFKPTRVRIRKTGTSPAANLKISELRVKKKRIFEFNCNNMNKRNTIISIAKSGKLTLQLTETLEN